MKLGYSLISEEHPPDRLIRNARRAEQVGFDFAMVSDHFHPWLPVQGESPFVWSTLGGMAQITERMRIGTGVTCPLIRIHPALVAQAAATCGVMFTGRFFLGLGTGENLNEHVVGSGWPPAEVRLEMLQDAVQVIRTLLQGGERSYRGPHYTIENARLYTCPEDPPDLYLAAIGEQALKIAGELGDGLISLASDSRIVDLYQQHAPADTPRIGQTSVCYHENPSRAREIAHRRWPQTCLGGSLSWDLPTPSHFESACDLVSEEMVEENVLCGGDADAHRDRIQDYVEAGFDRVCVHQIGEEQEPFFEFYESEVIPAVDELIRE